MAYRGGASASQQFSETDGAASRFPSESFVSFSSSIDARANKKAGLQTDIVFPENIKDGAIGKVASSPETQQADGFQAWVVCTIAFLDSLLLYGLLNIYSLFMVQFQQDMGATLANAATLGSLSCGLVQLFGPVSSYLTMRFGNRAMMMIGSCICCASACGSSYVKTFNLLFATFAVPYALGTSLVNVPAYVVPMEYFKKYRAITTGIIASGSSMGMLLMAPIAQVVLEKYGWRIAFRALSLTFLFLMVINALVTPPAKPPAQPAAAAATAEVQGGTTSSLWEDLKVWNNRVFSLWVSVIAIVYFGYNIPIMFLASYAMFVGLTPKSASYIFMAMGGATTVSRLATGGVMTCDLLSRLHVKQIIFVLMGTTHLLLSHVVTIEGLYVFAVVRGLLDGAHTVMLPNLTASIVGAKRAIMGWGHLAGAISITYTVGPLAAGAVMDATGSYVGPFIMSGLPLIIAGLLLFLLPWAQSSYKRAQLLKKFGPHTDQSPHPLELLPTFWEMHKAPPAESIEEFIIQHHASLMEQRDRMALLTAQASKQSPPRHGGSWFRNKHLSLDKPQYSQFGPLARSASDSKIIVNSRLSDALKRIHKCYSDSEVVRQYNHRFKSSL